MGLELSKDMDTERILKSYQMITENLDPIFGKGILVFDNKEKIKLFLKTIEFEKKKDFLKYFEKLQKRSQLKNDNIIQLRTLHIKVDEGIFQTVYKIYLFFDHSSMNLVEYLSKEKRNKANPRLMMSQFEAIFMINSLVKGLKFMLSSQMIFDVQPENILLTKKMGYKIVDSQLLGFEDPIRKIRKSKKSLVYLSPEQLQELSKNNKKEGVQNNIDEQFGFLDKKKIAVFQLGVIIISLLLNHHQTIIFDYKYRTVKMEMLQMQLNQIGNIYDEDVRNIVGGMVEADPLQRLEIQQTDVQIQSLIKSNQQLQDYLAKRNSSQGLLQKFEMYQTKSNNQNQEDNFKQFESQNMAKSNLRFQQDGFQSNQDFQES